MRYSLLLVALMAWHSGFAQDGKKQVTLDDIYKNNTFRIKSVPGFNAMKDGLTYTQLDADGEKQVIRMYDLATGNKGEVLFDNVATKFDGKTLHIDEYSFSKDEKLLMLRTENQNVYRRSVAAYVFVYDIANRKLRRVNDEKILHATISPDGKKIAYVRNNNLYVMDFLSGDVTALTTDGEWNKIINGNCDWVYEEEFGFTKAFDWSPDSKYIAYYRFDESGVPMYTMPMYYSLYPDNNTFKYPKAGEPNSIIQVKLYDIAANSTTTADIGAETDQYIPRIKWSHDPKRLCIYRMNRLQNKLELLLTNAATGKSKVIYTETSPYYLDIDDNLAFLPDNSSFIFTSEQDEYNHLYRYDWKKKQMTDLTPGKYDMADLVGVDEKNEVVYYTAAKNSPMERKLYVVNWNGSGTKLLTPKDGTHAITRIEGFNYFLDKFSTLTDPPVFTLINSKGKVLRALEDNKELKATMQQYELGKIEFKKIKLPGSNSLNAWMITPPDFNPDKKYPVLMYQYSGPGSQEVADRFPIRDFFWHQMLAEKGYIIVCADGTGTGMRGEAFKKKTYLQLGKYESDDQISVARYLADQSYVDKNRIGIWGWSYGGFMSSTCILKGNDVFKMAIAVAPVTNWRYYDNIYTERYMRTPKENAKGYDENAPEKMAANLKGKFLLIHGTADDNVHFQNSIMLTDALIKADKQFDGAYYPNKAHGISGGNTRYHLYKKMTDFIQNNL